MDRRSRGDEVSLMKRMNRMMTERLIMINNSPGKQELILAPKQTSFVFYRFRKSFDSSAMSEKSPELSTVHGIEKFLLDNKDRRKAGSVYPIDMNVSSVPISSHKRISCTKDTMLTFTHSSRLNWRLTNLASHYGLLSSNQLKDIFTLYMTDDVDLVLYWDIPGAKRQGHHFIIGINLAFQPSMQLQLQKRLATTGKTSRALYAQTVREKAALLNSFIKRNIKDVSPVRVLLTSKAQTTHNFDSRCVSSEFSEMSFSCLTEPYLQPLCVECKDTREELFMEYEGAVLPGDVGTRATKVRIFINLLLMT